MIMTPKGKKLKRMLTTVNEGKLWMGIHASSCFFVDIFFSHLCKGDKVEMNFLTLAY